MADQESVQLLYTLAPAPQVQSKLTQQMADLERGLKLKGPFSGLSQSTRSFSDELTRANQRVITLGASFATLSTSVRILKDIVSSTIAVEKAFTDINAVFQLSAQGLDKFSKNLFDAARNTGQSFEKAAEAAKEFSRQGLTSEETIKRTTDALILTRLANIDVAKSVDVLTASINGFQKSALNSSEIINKLATVDAKFAVSSSDLAEGLARAGAAASDAGISFDQLIGLITAAQQTTARGGSVIGNAFKTIFTRVEKRDTIEAIESLGIAVRDTSGDFLTALPLLENFAKAYDGLGPTLKKQAANIIGGTQQINILKAVLGDLAKANGIAAQATDISANATNEATLRNEELNKSLDSMLAKLGVTAKQIGSNIGSQSFQGPLKGLLNIVSDNPITKALQDASGKAESTGGQIAQGILKGIGGTLIYGLGPLIGKALFKVVGNTTGNLFRDFQDLSGLKTKSQEQAAIQGEVVNLYRAGGTALQQQLAAMTSLTEKAALLQRLLTATGPNSAAQLAGALYSGGYRGKGATVPRAAGGYVPSAARGYVPHAAGGIPRPFQSIILPPSKPNIRSVGLTRGASPVGEGHFGAVVKSPDADIVFKQFKGGQYPERTEGDIRSEYAISKLAESLGLPVAKVYGTANRSVKRRGLYKEYVKGVRGDELRYGDQLAVEAALANRFIDSGINPVDLVGNNKNYMIRPGNGWGREDLINRAVVVDPGAFQLIGDQRGGAQMPAYNKAYYSKAGGYIPHAADGLPLAQEAAAIGAGVGGAHPDSRPVYLPDFNRGDGGRGIVANTSEYRVPTPAGEAIYNQDMVRRMGLPAGAKQITAARGYVPHAAEGSLRSSTEIASGYSPNAPKSQLQAGLQRLALAEAEAQKAIETTVSKLATGLGKVSSTLQANVAISGLGGVLPANQPPYPTKKQFAQLNVPVKQRSSDFEKAKAEVDKANAVAIREAQKKARELEALASLGTPRSNPLSAKQIGQLDELTAKTLASIQAKEDVKRLKLIEEANFAQRQKRSIENSNVNYGNRRSPIIDTAGGEIVPRGKSGTFARVVNPNIARDIEEVHAVMAQLRIPNKYANEANQSISSLGTVTSPSIAAIQRGPVSVLPSTYYANRAIARFDTRFTAPSINTDYANDAIRSPYLPSSPLLLGLGARGSVLQHGPFREKILAPLYEKDETFRSTRVARFEARLNDPTTREQAMKESQTLQDFQNKRDRDQRSLAYDRAVDKLTSGNDITGAQNRLITEQLKSQGYSQAASLYGPGASKKAIDMFVKDFVQKKYDEFNRLGEAAFSEQSRAPQTFLGRARSKIKGAFQPQNLAYAAAFGLPFVGGLIDEGKSGTTSGIVRGIASNGATGAGLGASIGIGFGAPGAAIGAGIGGVIGGVYGALSKMTKSFEDFAKEVQDITEKINTEAQAVSRIFELNDQLNQARKSGAKGSKLRDLNEQINENFSNVKTPELRDLLTNRLNDPTARGDAVNIINSRNARETRAPAFGGQIAGALESGSLAGFHGFDDKARLRLIGALQPIADKLSDEERTAFRKQAQSNPTAAIEAFGEKAGLNEKERKEITAKARPLDSTFNKGLGLVTLGNSALVQGVIAQQVDNLFESAILETLDNARRNGLKSFADAAGKQGQRRDQSEESLEKLSSRFQIQARFLQAEAEGAQKVLGTRQQIGLANPSLTEQGRIGLQTRFEQEAIAQQTEAQRQATIVGGKGALAKFLKDSGNLEPEVRKRVEGVSSLSDLEGLVKDAKTKSLPLINAEGFIEAVDNLIENLKVLNKTEEVQTSASKQVGDLLTQQLARTRSFEGARDEDIGAFARALDNVKAAQTRNDSSDTIEELLSTLNATLQRQLVRSGSRTETQGNTELLRNTIERDLAKRTREDLATAGLGRDYRVKTGAQLTESDLSRRLDEASIQFDVVKQLGLDEATIDEAFANFNTLFQRFLQRTGSKTEGQANVDIEKQSIGDALRKRQRDFDTTEGLGREFRIGNAVDNEDLTFKTKLSGADIDLNAAKRYGADEGTIRGLRTQLSDLRLESQRRAGTLDEGEERIKRLEERVRSAQSSRFAPGSEISSTKLDLARERGLQGDSFGSLKGGFQSTFAGIKRDLNDLSDLGKSVADSLSSNLGGAWGDFVTGAKVGKDAFRDFVTSVLGEASRALGSKALTGLLSFIPGFAGAAGAGSGGGGLGATTGGGGGFDFGGATGGRLTTAGFVGYAAGGMVPSMVMGGEYYVSPKAAKRIGYDTLRSLNKYADGGLIRGGSGVRDDVPANLPVGSFILRKSATQRLGSDYLHALVGGQVQHRFIGGILGGVLAGAAVGGGLGYITGGKQGAIGGAIAGGIGGGLYANSTTGGGTGAALSQTQKTLVGLGISAGVGMLAAGIGNKGLNSGNGSISLSQVPALRAQLEADQNKQLNDRGGKQVFLQLNPQGGHSLAGIEDAPATRRWAEGGEVGGSTLSSPRMGGDANTQVSIKIEINNNGQVSSASNGKEPFGEGSANRLEKTVKGWVQEEIVRQNRPDGFFAQRGRYVNAG